MSAIVRSYERDEAKDRPQQYAPAGVRVAFNRRYDWFRTCKKDQAEPGNDNARSTIPDENGKTFEVVEIIGDAAVINYETYGAQVVLTQFIDEGVKDGELSRVDPGLAPRA